MEWKEYLNLSEKTLSTEFHCDSKKTELLLHAVMGIITELEEIIEWKEDVIGKTEEFGDICWYLAIIAREYDIELPKSHVDVYHNKSDNTTIVLNMFKRSSLLLDFLKKKLFYNKPINDEKFVDITNILIHDAYDYSNLNAINIKKSFDLNIKKLQARYGEKFTSERAVNRDLVIERNILEGK